MSILQLYRLKVLPMLVNQSVTYVGESDQGKTHREHRGHRLDFVDLLRFLSKDIPFKILIIHYADH